MKKRARRRGILLAAVVVLGIIGYIWWSGGGGGISCDHVKGHPDTPEKVARAAVQAIPDRDIGAVIRYFTPAPGEMMARRLQKVYAAGATMELRDLRTMLIYQEGIAARVSAVYDIVYTAAGSSSTEHYNITIKLVKIQGPDGPKWYINEAF